MTSTLKIGYDTYTLKASLHTFLNYKALFGHDLLDDLSEAEKELEAKEHDNKCDGCIIYLQVLYALIEEGNGAEMPFLEWLEQLDQINLSEIVKAVTGLITSTMKPDRRNRMKTSVTDEFASSMTIEEISIMLLETGMNLSDFHDITFGMALNMLWEHTRSLRRRRGERVEDPERTYKIMKANLPALTELHDKGKVSDEEYEEYTRKIREWESDS